jgi:hypothetical protein
MVRVVFKKPDERPQVMEIEDTLEKYQELVGGFIETVPANEDGTIIMIVNEDGKLLNLEPNIWTDNDCIVGNIIFVQNCFDGEFHSLTDEMVADIMQIFI